MSRSDDMAALREQVQAGHLHREGFIASLTQSGVDLGKANQAASKANQAANKVNQAANKERKRSLMEALAALAKGRKQEAGRQHEIRAKFVSDLARATAAQRKVNASENAAARSAWFGAAMAAV